MHVQGVERGVDACVSFSGSAAHVGRDHMHDHLRTNVLLGFVHTHAAPIFIGLHDHMKLVAHLLNVIFLCSHHNGLYLNVPNWFWNRRHAAALGFSGGRVIYT